MVKRLPAQVLPPVSSRAATRPGVTRDDRRSRRAGRRIRRMDRYCSVCVAMSNTEPRIPRALQIQLNQADRLGVYAVRGTLGRFCARRCRFESATSGVTMKIVVIGGTGLIGSKTVAILRQGATRSSPPRPKAASTHHRRGPQAAMAGAQVVIDLTNSPSFEDRAVLEFFETSGRNLLAAEAAAGVRHHVALPSSEPTGATMAISAPRSPKRN